MVVKGKIKHVDRLANGVLRFRRKFPKDVCEALDRSTLQVHIRNKEGVPFAREYEAIMREFDRIVSETRADLRRKGTDNRTNHEKWHDALLERAGLIERSFGLDDDDGAFIAENMPPETDPMLLKALSDPNAPAPGVTLADAKIMYERDKRLPQNEVVRLNRITRRLEEALGQLDKVQLKDLRREHGRSYMNLMLRSIKSNGEPLSISTCQKESKIICAMINHGLREADLQSIVSNPFVGLPWPADAGPKVNKKLPLPDDLIQRVEQRLNEGRTIELPLIWQILKGTGMRLGEVAGLSKEDISLDTEPPHILVRPNAIRDLKTASSNRSVPLTGEALTATMKAFEGVRSGAPVFARYARDRGADAASAALMKAVRAETNDKRLSVHGLRHRVSDKLRDVGAPVEVRHGFLGHSSTAIAETTYGSPKARLIEFARWAKKAEL